MRLYDTARRAVVAVRAAADRAHVRVRDHAVRLDAPRARGDVSHLRPLDPPARGARPRGALRPQRHRRRRLDPAQGPRARRAVPRARRSGDGAVPQRHGRARDARARRRTARDRVDRPDHRARRAAARIGQRVPHARHRVLRRVDVPALRRALALLRRARWSASRERAAAIPTIRTGASRSTSCCGSRRCRTSPRGARRSASVGPVGTSSARRWRCTSTARPSTCTAAEPISSSRTTRARSRRARASPGKPFVTHWLHSAMVNYDGEKMSKSLGNLVFVDELLKTADPRAIRLALLRHHYRHGFEWYHTDLEEGTALLHRLLAAAARTTGPDPRTVRPTRTRRDRRRSRHATRARRARRSRQRDPVRRRRPARTRCCASSVICSASTSSAHLTVRRRRASARKAARSASGRW